MHLENQVCVSLDSSDAEEGDRGGKKEDVTFRPLPLRSTGRERVASQLTYRKVSAVVVWCIGSRRVCTQPDFVWFLLLSEIFHTLCEQLLRLSWNLGKILSHTRYALTKRALPNVSAKFGLQHDPFFF